MWCFIRIEELSQREYCEEAEQWGRLDAILSSAAFRAAFSFFSVQRSPGRASHLAECMKIQRLSQFRLLPSEKPVTYKGEGERERQSPPEQGIAQAEREEEKEQGEEKS